MDVKFPLTYTSFGSIALVDAPEKYASQVKHILSTIVRERRLFPTLGFPVDLLFQLPLPELVSERVRLALLPYIPIPFSVTTKSPNGKGIVVTVTLGEQQEQEVIFDFSALS